jgi:hypothetical protein
VARLGATKRRGRCGGGPFVASRLPNLEFEADLQHDLLRGRDFQRIDDAGRRETGRDAHRPLDRLGISSIAAQYELAIDIIDPNALATGSGLCNLDREGPMSGGVRHSGRLTSLHRLSERAGGRGRWLS